MNQLLFFILILSFELGTNIALYKITIMILQKSDWEQETITKVTER